MRISQLTQFPKTRAYAILTFTKTTSSSMARHPQLEVFDDEEEWMDRIKALATPSYGSPTEFRAFTMEPVGVKTKVEVDWTYDAPE